MKKHEESELRLTDPSTCNICRVTVYTIVTVTVILCEHIQAGVVSDSLNFKLGNFEGKCLMIKL